MWHVYIQLALANASFFGVCVCLFVSWELDEFADDGSMGPTKIPSDFQEEDPDGAEGDLSLGRGGVKVKGGKGWWKMTCYILCTYKVKIDGKVPIPKGRLGKGPYKPIL